MKRNTLTWTSLLLLVSSSCALPQGTVSETDQYHEQQDNLTPEQKEDFEYWWQKNVGTFLGDGTQEVTDIGAGQTGSPFTPSQSQHCEVGFDCVPWQMCIDDYISTDGAYQIDLRTKNSNPPPDVGYKVCGQTGNVCCRIPKEILDQQQGGAGYDLGKDKNTGNHDGKDTGNYQTDPVYVECSAGQYCVEKNTCNLYTGYIGEQVPQWEGQPITEYSLCKADGISEGVCCQKISAGCGKGFDCVPYFQCINGTINTDGTDLINIRIKPPSTCVNPDYTDVPGLCCKIPGYEPPVVEPKPLDNCPEYLECVDLLQCGVDGSVNTDGAEPIDVSIHINKKCYWATDLVGVCCPPPVKISVCPEESVCIDEYSCTGQILDSYSKFVPYAAGGVWSKCSYSSDNTPGVCCVNPKTTSVPKIYKAATYCGVRNTHSAIDTRIQTDHSEPNEANFGEFPWQAIIFYSNYTFKCGASLIGDSFLLTGTHCVDGLKPYDIRIRLGEWQVNSFDEDLPYEDVEVKTITVHPDFKATSVWNDVAVIELTKPVTFKYHINSVCLPSYGQVFPEGTRCFASGWGKDAFEGTYQHIMKKIDLPIVENEHCQALLRKTRLGKYFLLHKSFMCAGGEENKDACRGDGGGPLVCEDPSTGRYVLTGITAWGIGCGTKDIPGVYADVQHFYGWIHNIIDPSYQQQHTDAPGYERK